jgi:NAD(P)-dependent dehydrogenase (short-subunit alcohol dehydrogenase family)
VNVSAAEGRFAQFKTGFHPHTNMAKAALNMLTRTIADEYAEQGICVVSVDPGWVSDQIPHTSDISRQLGAARLPIDLVDAASRICDPLFSAVQGETVAVGRLFKDYDVVDW